MKNLRVDREKRVSAGTRNVILPKFLRMPSSTPIAGSPPITTVSSTVSSTTSINVVVSPALPTPSVQSPQSLHAGSPEVLSLQLDAAEVDPFLEEVRSTSTLSVVTTSSSTAVVTETTQSREPDSERSEATNPLERKEAKRRGRRKKKQNPSGHNQREKHEPTRRQHESDSDGEWNADTRKGHQCGSRKGNGRGKHGSDRDSTKADTTRKRSPKGQHSCAVAMSLKSQTGKSIVSRAEPITTTVSESSLVFASPRQ